MRRYLVFDISIVQIIPLLKYYKMYNQNFVFLQCEHFCFHENLGVQGYTIRYTMVNVKLFCKQKTNSSTLNEGITCTNK